MKKILLVEDERVLSEMYKNRFSKAGLKVYLASEAKEGLQQAKKIEPDLIILDILLPRENGIFFLEKWAKDSKISSIPVIIFSNFDDPHVRKRAKKLGAKDYLIKTNYTPRQITEKVKQYLK